MKWEALLAMAALFLLGLWLVWGGGGGTHVPDMRDGARVQPIKIGNHRGVIEIVDSTDTTPPTFRILMRNADPSAVLGGDRLAALLPPAVYQDIIASEPNHLFRLLNITSWGSLLWVCIGLGGQGAFFGRMAVQWMVSEKRKESIVPDLYWWLSMVGGIALFTYFVWRQDIVGVLGQTTGVVVYARNIRLIVKKKGRTAREATREADRAARQAAAGAPPDADPEP